MALTSKGEIDLGIQTGENSTTAKRRLIFFGNAGETSPDLLKSGLLPETGTAHPRIPGLCCRSVSVSVVREGFQRKFTADAVYSDTEGVSRTRTLQEFSAGGDGQAFDIRVAPVENIVPFEFSYDKTIRKNGRILPAKPVVNSVGNPISASTVQISLLLRFSYYLRYFEPSWILTKNNTLNAESCEICGLSFPSETGLLRNLSMTGIKKGIVRIDVEIEHNPESFVRRFGNRGFYCRMNSENGTPARIFTGFNRSGEPVFGHESALIQEGVLSKTTLFPSDEPQWLAANGTVAGTSGEHFSPEILEFRDKRTESWRILNFPSTGNW